MLYSQFSLRRKGLPRIIFFSGILIVLLLFQNTSFAQYETGGFDFEGQSRQYRVYLPNNYNSSQFFPLVIYLHSYDWTPQQGMNYTVLYEFAQSSGFLLCCPKGIQNWNSGIGDDDNWPTPDVNDVGFINALIDTLNAHYSIDLYRVYACGFSNGGFMSYKLACQLSHRFAAIASVGGVMSSSTATNFNPLHAVPVLQIHGTEDNSVSIGGNNYWLSVDQTLNYWIDFNHCISPPESVSIPDTVQTDFSTVEKMSYKNNNGETRVVYYKVDNGGHSWPGSSDIGSPVWEGAKNRDIYANVEIWNFFKNFKSPCFVYPGDTDNNGVVDAYDILPVGIHFLKQGTIRTNSSLDWNPQPVSGWTTKAAGHADANGDGRVDEKDVISIGVNWGNRRSISAKAYEVSLTDTELLDAHHENFQVLYQSIQGHGEAAGEIKILLEKVLGIDESDPGSFALHQNYPNPFNPKTTISYQLHEQCQVELAIFNSSGQQIKTLFQGLQNSGVYKFEWDASNFPSGVYFSRLKIKDEYTGMKKLALIK